MAVTQYQYNDAYVKYEILNDAIIDLQHCIEELRKYPGFSDYAYTLTEIRKELGSKQSECETILDEWEREQERLDRIAYERGAL